MTTTDDAQDEPQNEPGADGSGPSEDTSESSGTEGGRGDPGTSADSSDGGGFEGDAGETGSGDPDSDSGPSDNADPIGAGGDADSRDGADGSDPETGSADAGDPGNAGADTGGDTDPAASETDDGATTDDGSGTAPPTDETSPASADSTGTGASSDPIDLGPPYLIVDQYSGDSGMNPPWATLVGLPHYYGAILKAWEGGHFNDGGWFAHNWPAVKQAGGDRYGSSWFRGAYLFLKFDTDADTRADAYLQAVDAAGGWDNGDILPVVDVELGGTANTNHRASKQQVIDCVSACAARIKDRTGRRVMLYGRGAMRDLGIRDKMGADVAWNPSYTPTMHKAGLEAFALDEIVLWQYCGDNQAYLPNYPHQVSGFAKLDISVFLKGSAEPTLDDVRAGLLS